MKKSVFILLWLTTLIVRSQTAQTDPIISNFLADPALSNAAVSIYVAEANTGKVVLSSAPQLCLVPASVLKLVTTATALELLGGDFRFSTSVLTDGKQVDSRLNGNLIVNGGGDPTLASGYFPEYEPGTVLFENWARKIKAMGIDTINGDLIVNESLYPKDDIPSSWLWEDLGQYYGAVARGVALYDNTFSFVFETGPAGTPAQITSASPSIPGLTFRNEVLASEDQRDQAYVFGSPYDSFRVIKGTLPQYRSRFEVKSSIPDPALLLADEFSLALKKEGIILMGKSTKDRPVNDTASDSILFIHHSPPLGQIITQLNYHSINLFAEHLCKHLGLLFGNGATTLSGTETIKAYWSKQGIDTRSLYMTDGSGLSRSNAITARILTEILCSLKKSPVFEQFYQSIPLAGQQGTMQNYFREHPLKGRAHIKSGSMTRVRSFSGYFTTQKGTELAFTIITNNFSCTSSEMVSRIEALLSKIDSKY